MRRRLRALVGSCGGLTGVYLAKRLSLDPGVEVVGADCSADSVGFRLVGERALLPRAADPGFAEALCALLGDAGIDIYLPTHSAEMRAVSWAEGDIRAACPNVSFLVSPFPTFEALDDKLRLAESLGRAGVPAPALVEAMLDDGGYPVFMKARRGSGGSGGRLVPSRAAHEAAAAEAPGAVFMEYVEGYELTVDCMFDAGGALLGYNQRRRVKTLGGAAIVAENDWRIDVGPLIERMASSFMFKGCVNFQCIVRGGVPYFTDANLRYPSGGLPLSVESGLDVPALTVSLLAGRSVGPVRVDRSPRRMYRYFEEIFEVPA